MNNWKKYLGMALALCLLLGVIPVTAETNTDISGTVRFATAYQAHQGISDLLADFNELYPNITVEHIRYSNSESGNIQTDIMMMAGEIDVLSSYTQDRTAGRTDFFVDLREYLAAEGLDMATEWGAEIEFDGGLYGIPFDGLNYFIAINMDAWNEAGLGELPTEWTWDEYLEACRAMTKEGVYGGSDYHVPDAFGYAVRQQLGANMYFGEDGLTNFITNPAWKTAIERKIQAENVENIWMPQIVYYNDGKNSQTEFLNGNVASFVTCNVWRFIVDEENYPHDFQVGFAPYPTENEGDTCYVEGPVKYAFACISKNAQDFDAAWAFTKFLTMEGDKYLLKAGHLPTWSQTNVEDAVELVFGDEETAAELVDVESFKRVVLNFDGTSYVDTIVYSEIYSITKEVIMYILADEMTVDEGLLEMQERCDEVILEAQN